MINTDKQILVKTRPNHGKKQVKKVSEIEMGKMYRRHHALGTEIVIPVRRSYKEDWMKAKVISDSGIITEKDIAISSIKNQSLSDWGVIPYSPSYMWNPNNWLEKVKKEDIIVKPNEDLLLNTPEDFYNLNQEQREILVKWIKTNLKPRKYFNREMTSYGLKHFFEEDKEGFYIHNGQFKGAMLECGFKPHQKNELNWYFNISRKSITKLSERKR